MFMDEKLILVSWASLDDPAPGEFKFQKEEIKQYIIRKERSIYWKSGVSGDFISESDDMNPSVSSLLSNINGSHFNLTKLINSSYIPNITTSSSFNETKTRLVMNYDGNVQYFTLQKESGRWDLTWEEPQDQCNVFRACGNSTSCNSKNNLRCACLPGFEPVSPDNWNSGDISEGCHRKMPLCSNGVENFKSFKPLTVNRVGKADVKFEANNENECKEECLKGCECQAYSFQIPEMSQLRGVKACWIWSDDLNNIQLDNTDEGREIHLRIGAGPSPIQLNIGDGPIT
ncbi:hypothetical protein Q3G72_020994 [Acer saccharum]|nr:hypothetical protein Q3G72_020994 [Acer saccharum]